MRSNYKAKSAAEIQTLNLIHLPFASMEASKKPNGEVTVNSIQFFPRQHNL